MNKHPKGGNIFPSRRQPGLQVSFQEAFPEIESLKTEVTEIGEGNQGLGIRRLNKLSVREFINCSNYRCAGKGFGLGEILRGMIADHATDRTVQQPCQSFEEGGKACPNVFNVQIHLEYNPRHG